MNAQDAAELCERLNARVGDGEWGYEVARTTRTISGATVPENHRCSPFYVRRVRRKAAARPSAASATDSLSQQSLFPT